MNYVAICFKYHNYGKLLTMIRKGVTMWKLDYTIPYGGRQILLIIKSKYYWRFWATNSISDNNFQNLFMIIFNLILRNENICALHKICTKAHDFSQKKKTKCTDAVCM